MMDDLCGYFFRSSSGKKPGASADDASMASKPIPFNDDDELVSPFIAYKNDNHRYPDLYSELDECIEACVLIYPLAELRKMARANELEDPQKILQLPLTHKKVMEYVEINKDKLMGKKFSKDFYLNILAAADERNMTKASTSPPPAKDSTREASNSQANQRPTHRQTVPSSIIAFDDEFEKEELVYSIEVHHKRKRITVCFRGSETKTDWATDFQIWMKEVPSPIKGGRGPKTVKVHNGFHDYLFEDTERGAKGPNGEPLSEFEEILQEHVLPVIKQCPKYKVRETYSCCDNQAETSLQLRLLVFNANVALRDWSQVSAGINGFCSRRALIGASY